jgi:hypothetical protein
MGTIFLLDTFDGPLDETLLTHKGEIGADWVINSTETTPTVINSKLNGNGGLKQLTLASGVSPYRLYPSTYPKIPNYTVRVEFSASTFPVFPNVSNQLEIGLGFSASTRITKGFSYILAWSYISPGSQNFNVSVTRFGTSPSTSITFYPLTAFPFKLKNSVAIHLSGLTKSFFVNDVLIFSVTEDLFMQSIAISLLADYVFSGDFSFDSITAQYDDVVVIPSSNSLRCITPHMGKCFPPCKIY